MKYDTCNIKDWGCKLVNVPKHSTYVYAYTYSIYKYINTYCACTHTYTHVHTHIQLHTVAHIFNLPVPFLLAKVICRFGKAAASYGHY